MKKLKIILLFCATVAIGVVACSDDKDETPENGIEVSNLTTIIKPSVLMPIDDAKAMMDTYNEDLRKNPVNGAAHFVDFNYNDLKEYLAYIEKESKDAEVSIEALRFYFGQYPESYPSGKSVKNPNRKSLFYNPVTSFPDSNGNISYAIKTLKDGTKMAVKIGDLIEAGETNDSNIRSMTGDELGWPPPPLPRDPDDFH